jgi:hypothetical protein
VRGEREPPEIPNLFVRFGLFLDDKDLPTRHGLGSPCVGGKYRDRVATVAKAWCSRRPWSQGATEPAGRAPRSALRGQQLRRLQAEVLSATEVLNAAPDRDELLVLMALRHRAAGARLPPSPQRRTSSACARPVDPRERGDGARVRAGLCSVAFALARRVVDLATPFLRSARPVGRSSRCSLGGSRRSRSWIGRRRTASVHG